MSTPILASPAHSHNPKPEVIRRTAGYHPTVWGDRFLNYTPEDTITQARKEQQIEELRKEVRRELMAATASEPLQELNLIDAVQRQVRRELMAATASEPLQELDLIDAVQGLGVAYHF